MPAEIAKDGTMKEALVSAGTAALTPRQVGLTLSSPGPSPGPSPRVGQSPNESRAASFRRSAALGFLEEKLHIQMDSWPLLCQPFVCSHVALDPRNLIDRAQESCCTEV
ncbi:unnamed protein product [Effrenium voratum]|nr:unnamed protein product [Effrenium voratum]